MKLFILTSGLLIILAGTTIEIGALGPIEIDDIIASAFGTVNKANIHQFATALELYYSDNNHYPFVQNGEEMITLLHNEGYIKSLPFDKSTFDYKFIKNGQDYQLSIIN